MTANEGAYLLFVIGFCIPTFTAVFSSGNVAPRWTVVVGGVFCFPAIIKLWIAVLFN